MLNDANHADDRCVYAEFFGKFADKRCLHRLAVFDMSAGQE